jgi:hypothetical protein
MLQKNEARLIPFQQLEAEIGSISKELQQERLHATRAIAERTNNRKLETYKKDAAKYFDPEAGSDGIEEYVREAVDFPNPEEIELNPKQIAECNDIARTNVVDTFISTYNLGSKYTWLLPQLTAIVGSWKPIKNEIGNYDGRLTVAEACREDLFNRGIYYVLQYAKRSELISGTDVRLYKVGEYNNLVPLMLNAFKTYQNIPYSAWDKLNLNFVVDKDLREAMLSEPPNLTNEEILELRNEGMLIKSGAKKNQHRDPRTASMLYGIKEHPKWGPVVADIPRLTLVMITQIWCAHPSNRTHHMVLDPYDWDNMPPPLLSSEPIVTTPKKPKPTDTAEDIPWNP